MSTVDTQHPDYARMVAKWQRCRNTVSGQDAIHDGGERYLPRLKDQIDADYKAYKLRASFFGAVWRTIDGLSGMMFRKPPEIEAPETILPLLDDVTMGGKSLHILAQQTTIEILTSGRLGILVDHPQESTAGKSMADAQAANLRPSMQAYPAESIINWRTSWIGNATVLSLVVLKESAALPGNEFEHKSESRYRVLDLAVTAPLEGKSVMAYRVRVFRINDKQEDEQVGPDIFPKMNGKTLDFIPFFFIGVDDTTPDLDEPPLIDLVDANIAHYRLDADHKHGLHFTGLPTAVISGYAPPDGEKLYIGSQKAWCFPDPQAKATYLEYTGQGLGAIAEEKAKTEERMAILGARLLASEKKDAETAQTAQIHRAGETSILSKIAHTISIGLTSALKVFCEWAGVSGDCSIELNDEFVPPGITPQELTALLAGWQMGAPGLSDQGLFDILKKREVVAEDVTLEEEQERIKNRPMPEPDLTGGGKQGATE